MSHLPTGVKGSDLLADAPRRTLRLADEVSVFGVHTHAIDEDAKAFYIKFGFVPLLDQDRHMFLVTATIRKGGAKSGKR